MDNPEPRLQYTEEGAETKLKVNKMVQVTRNKQIRSAIIGMILGDGHIHKDNFHLMIIHCYKQKEYLNMKRDIVQKKQKSIIEVKDYDNHGYSGCMISTKKRPIYRILRKMIYKDGTKTISRKILDYLDELGIAIWYQDNGSLSAKKRNGKIHSYELTLNTYLSKEQNEIIIKYFQDKWNIKWGLSKSKGKYRLRMGVKEGRKFAKIIEPYIVECMNYKIKPLVTAPDT